MTAPPSRTIISGGGCYPAPWPPVCCEPPPCNSGGSGGGGGSGTLSVALTGITANGSRVTLPALAVIQAVLITETAGHPVAVSIGTGVGTADVLAPTDVPANGVVPVGLYGLTNVVFQDAQPLFFSSSAWGGASINVKVWYVA